MRRVRVIPVLTIDNEKLVKTVKFKKPNYIGDPVNAVKIFNDKEVDEIVLLDITATKEKREPNYLKIEEICSEAFMPFAYGGGIRSIDQIDKLFQLGIEKVVLNSVLADEMDLIQKAADKFGAQSIVGSIDVKKSILGAYHVYTHSGENKMKKSLEEHVSELIKAGVGEIIVTSINKEGTFGDYDFDLVKKVASISNVPVVANGGAKNLASFRQAIEAGASAVAAGSQFVYRGDTKGIMINYPSQDALKADVFIS